MIGDPYAVFDDPYCYKGTSVLKNKARLRDLDQLSAFELEMTTLRAAEPLPDGRFDIRHYCAVHHHLFQDVYRWAGKIRTVRTAKGGNHFCFPEHINASLKALFAQLHEPTFLPGVPRREFMAAAAEFLAELNVIHCFRDGNGRAQLAFLFLVSVRAGHPINLERLRETRFLRAMIRSFAGDFAPLRAELLFLQQ